MADGRPKRLDGHFQISWLKFKSTERRKTMENENKEKESARKEDKQVEIPSILKEINIEELAVDGICGIY
jgi:hypothetical protein